MKNYPIRYWAPAILWGLVVLVLSTLPGEDLPKPEWADLLRVDKMVHTTFYSGFVFWLLWGNFKTRRGAAPFAAAILFCSMFGAGMEVIQKYFIPGRNFEWLDICANIFGSLLGGLVFQLYYRRYSLKSATAG